MQILCRESSREAHGERFCTSDKSNLSNTATVKGLSRGGADCQKQGSPPGYGREKCLFIGLYADLQRKRCSGEVSRAGGRGRCFVSFRMSGGCWAAGAHKPELSALMQVGAND